MVARSHLAFLAVIIAACGDSSGQVTTFVQGTAEAVCSWEAKCCTDAELEKMHGTVRSSATCQEYEELDLMEILYVERLAVKDGRIKVDEAAGRACLDKLNARVCNPKPGAPITPTDPTEEEDPCTLVFIGKTPIGNECIYQGECVPGAHCVSAGIGIGNGACVPYQQTGDICNDGSDCDPKVKGLYCAKKDYTCHRRGKVGEECEYTTDASGSNPTLPMLLECDDTPSLHLYCDTISKTCKTLPGADETCLAPPPPGVPYVCNPDPSAQLVCDTSGGTPGTCRAPAQLNQDCKAVNCAKGLYCDSSTKVCKTLPGLGADCTISNHVCMTPYYCEYNITTSKYTCVEPAQLNEDCSTKPCDTGLYCDPGAQTCNAKLGDGMACTSSIECLSGSCPINTHVCTPLTTGVLCTGK